MAPNANSVKDLSKWPVADYYNIWVVNKIYQTDCMGQWGGYANYPGSSAYNGTVIRSSSMSATSTVLPHELGHAFGLRHTFNGDANNTSCPLDSICTNQGDFVCDTPPHKQSDCGATNPCTTEGIWDK